MDRANSRSVFLPVIVAFVIGGFVLGCAGAKIRNVDVKSGEYYTEDEYKALGRRQKSRYCEELTAEMSDAQSEHKRIEQEIQDAKDTIKSIRRQIVPIEQEVLALESNIRTLNDAIDEVKSLPKEWKIKPGDTLTLIAMKPEIYNDIEKWTRIFEANQSIIDDPYYIFPDTVLVIPRDWPTD